ncbi:MAG: hypothetical protein JNJ88_17775 [Planctomycetes bacterium]|nr:hypothetical protein [Planctomycetota bacterium]
MSNHPRSTPIPISSPAAVRRAAAVGEDWLDRALDFFLGPQFRSELVNACALRRIPLRALSAEDVEELRGEAFFRYLEAAFVAGGGSRELLGTEAMRRALCRAVYHRFTKGLRRQRGARVTEIDESIADRSSPSSLEEERGSAPCAYRKRARLSQMEIPPEVVRAARELIGKLLARAAVVHLAMRSGSDLAAVQGIHQSDLGPRWTGVMRWLREFERDETRARVPRRLVEGSRGSELLSAGEVLMGCREVLHWSPHLPGAVARLAHAAVSTP